MSEIVEMPARTAAREGLAKPGEIIVIAAGMPSGLAGTTNLLRIERLPNERARSETLPPTQGRVQS